MRAAKYLRPAVVGLAQTVGSANGIAAISQPVPGGGNYVIKLVNLGLGPLEVTTTTTPHIAR